MTHTRMKRHRSALWILTMYMLWWLVHLHWRGREQYNTSHASHANGIPLQRTRVGRSKGWLAKQTSSTPCWVSSPRESSRYSATSASGRTSRRTQYLITTEPYPQDSTCRRCLGRLSLCARKELALVLSLSYFTCSRPAGQQAISECYIYVALHCSRVLPWC